MKNNTIKIQIVLFILFFIKTNPAQTWEKITPIFPSTDPLLQNTTVNFLNKDMGWIITSGSPKFGIQSIKLHETKNGGLEWQLELDLYGFSSLSHTTSSFDVNNIWFMGQAGDLVFSSNMGNNWDTSRVTFNNFSTSGWAFTSLFFFNDKNGLTFNDYRWFTSDGGYTWTKSEDTLTYFWGPTDVCFLNDSLGWIVSDINAIIFDVGYIANTTTGGRSWAYQDSITHLMYGIDFIDSLKGYAVGTNRKFSNGYIYSTIDGGQNWEYLRYDNVGPFWSIRFLDNLFGWISGSGKILRTTNGGETWEIQVEGMQTDFKQMIILKKDKVAYAFGKDWNDYSHTLLRADLSNITSIADDKDKLPEQFLLFGNYPNPFNPITTISYYISRYSHVELKVYNLLGEEIEKIVNKKQTAGKYEIKFEGSNLPSGIYFYQLKTNKFIQTKKMLLLH
ncbi:MAG: T9SS type A sorting domain-containing protein [Bacteroidetes bacterium]|nr:T9SS type A sorting domain-containing protein [Bacteroidota bacterium]